MPYLYSQVLKFESLTDGEILCASAVRGWTCSFVHPRDSYETTEIKARWVRARRLYGRHVTNYVIDPPDDVDGICVRLLLNGYAVGLCQLNSNLFKTVAEKLKEIQ